MSTFSNFPLLPQIQKSLDNLGFTTPTEIQEKVIPLLLENTNRDVHAQAQTGTGKTLAFGIPLLHAIDTSKKETQGLIIAPTRELVLQIHDSLRDVSRETGITIVPVYGGMSIERQISSIKYGAHIIVGTPGRLNDHLRRKTLSLKGLKILVLDEADIMLDMGFKQEVDDILTNAPHNRQIWLFSATVLDGIQQLINSHMKNVLLVRATKKSVVSSQVEQYYCVAPKAKRMEAMARLIEVAPDFYGIIFCQTKLLTSEVAEQLASRGFRASCLHGDMKQALRNQVIKGFKNRDFNILVATDVAARGIDVSDLTHVINFSIPQELESYVHRIGRTGRAGKQGIAIVLVAPSEVFRIKKLQRLTNVNLQEMPVPPREAIINAKMGAVSDFIEQSKKPRTEFSAVHKALEELVNSFTQEEIKQSFISALEDIFFKGGLREEFETISTSSTHSTDHETTQQEICIDLGKDAGISEKDISNYLHATCGLLSQEIRKVRVLNKRSFISIPEDKLQECLDMFKKNPFTPKKHRVFLVEDSFPPKGGHRSEGNQHRGRSRERSHGSRFERGGFDNKKSPMRKRRR